MAKTQNISVNYNEGLYYVNYDDIHMYHSNKDESIVLPASQIPETEMNKYAFDPTFTQIHYDAIRTKLANSLCAKFPSMIQPTEDLYADKRKTKRIIAHNELFDVILEDNQWSLAVALKQKPKGNVGLQTQMFPSFLNGLRLSLFEQFPVLYIRTGTWTAQPLTPDMPKDTGNMYVQPAQAYVTEDDA